MSMAFKQIPINSAKVSGSHSDMPVYLKPSAISGWASITLAEAQSSRWYSDEAKTVELAREIVSADEIHVKVPSLTSTTTIYVDYDGVRADYAVTDTYGRNAVWSEYEAIYHLQTLTEDSSGNSLTLTNKNTVTNGTGQVGDSADLGASNTNKNLYSSPNQITYTELASGFVVSQWLRPESLSTNNRAMRYILNNGSQERNFILDVNTTGKVNQGFFSGSAKNNTGTTTLSVNNWYLVHNIYDGGMKLYVSGSLDASTTWTWGGFSRSIFSAMALGAEQLTTGGSSGEFFKGEIDEVRFSVNSKHWGSNWITIEYNNQNDVATFWGTVTDAGGAPVANSGFMAFL